MAQSKGLWGQAAGAMYVVCIECVVSIAKFAVCIMQCAVCSLCSSWVGLSSMLGHRAGSEPRAVEPVCGGGQASEWREAGAQILRPLDDKSGVGHLTNPS